MMCCTKYNTCLNYKIRCADCEANSDIYNHYPLYKDRDLVEVVRCKYCKHSKEVAGNDGIIICNIDGETDEETGIDYGFVSYYSENHFCGYGERRKEDG